MNKEEVIKYLNSYHLDPNEYMVLAGSSMVIQGLKESTNNIDIAVSKKLNDYLLSNYKCEEKKEFDTYKVYIIDDRLIFSTNMFNTDEVIMYEGIPVESLEGIRNHKRLLGREKDIKDINIINKYLELNPLALAYLGDSVYEVYIRKFLIDKGITKVNDLSKAAKEYVSAKSQSRLLNKLIDSNYLKEEELEIVRRGRNTKSHGAPKNTDIITYKHATGFECLIGYLYLMHNTKRIENIIKEIIGD